MLNKNITYTDIDDQTVTETWSFHLSKSDLTKQIVGAQDGETYMDRLTRLSKLTPEDMKQGAGRQVIDTYEALILGAVGKRQGKNFIKNEEVLNDFRYSGAYDSFFMEMFEQPDSGASLIRAMLPSDLAANFDKSVAKQGITVADSGPTAFPGSVNAAREANGQPPVLEAAAPVLAPAEESKVIPLPSGDDEPTWLKESRYATNVELQKMTTAELQLAMKFKNAKAFG